MLPCVAAEDGSAFTADSPKPTAMIEAKSPELSRFKFFLPNKGFDGSCKSGVHVHIAEVVERDLGLVRLGDGDTRVSGSLILLVEQKS